MRKKLFLSAQYSGRVIRSLLFVEFFLEMLVFLKGNSAQAFHRLLSWFGRWLVEYLSFAICNRQHQIRDAPLGCENSLYYELSGRARLTAFCPWRRQTPALPFQKCLTLSVQAQPVQIALVEIKASISTSQSHVPFIPIMKPWLQAFQNVPIIITQTGSFRVPLLFANGLHMKWETVREGGRLCYLVLLKYFLKNCLNISFLHWILKSCFEEPVTLTTLTLEPQDT